MSIHKEIALEDGICAHLAAQGWLYEANVAARYDRASALFPEDLLAWVEATQPEAWAALRKAHGAAAGATLLQGRLLLLRLLAHELEPATALIRHVRGRWRQQAWGLAPHEPRIWAT